MLIKSAVAIPNPRGTAPGWKVERDGKLLIMMPGPPQEMTRMWEHEIVPELERRADSILVSRTLKTTGIGEGSVDEMLSPLLKGTNPSIGIYARADGVHARISDLVRYASDASPYRLLRAVPSVLYELGVVVTVALSFAPQTVTTVAVVRDARRLGGVSNAGPSCPD